MCCHIAQCHRLRVLKECAIGMLTAGMSMRAFARELNFSTISHLQHRFIEFDSISNWSYNHRTRVWCRVGERCPMVAMGLWYGQA
jgi:hypothetical protein